MTSPWRKLPDGFNRCSPVGFVTMGAFIPRYFGARYARWMIFSCVGQNANTNDSGTTLREPGVGCTACKLGSRTFSRIGLWYQRLDDRSRMNREVHVRFWEGLAVRFHWATQLFTMPSAYRADVASTLGSTVWRHGPPSPDSILTSFPFFRLASLTVRQELY